MSARDVLNDAIASTASELAESVDSEGAMCTGWVLIAEWTDATGGYWLSRMHDETSPSWRIKGLLHDALHDWQPGGDD